MNPQEKNRIELLTKKIADARKKRREQLDRESYSYDKLPKHRKCPCDQCELKLNHEDGTECKAFKNYVENQIWREKQRGIL